MTYIIIIAIIIAIFFSKSKKKEQAVNKSTQRSVSKMGSNDYGLAEMKRQEAEYNREFEAIKKADSYTDVNDKIAAYEQVLLKGTHWNSFSQKLHLAELYREAGKFDTAWGWLNKIYIDSMKNGTIEYEAPRIRRQMYLQLKQENKHLQAIDMYMCATLLFKNWNRKSFINVVRPLANKAGIGSKKAEDLADIMEYAFATNMTEDELQQQIKDLLIENS